MSSHPSLWLVLVLSSATVPLGCGRLGLGGDVESDCACPDSDADRTADSDEPDGRDGDRPDSDSPADGDQNDADVDNEDADNPAPPACLPPTGGDGQFSSFLPGPSLSVPRFDLTAAIDHQGSAWFIGGYETDHQSAAVDILPASGADMSPGPTLIYPMSENAAVFVPLRATIIMPGGDVSSPIRTSAVQAVNTADPNAWHTLPSMPEARAGHGVGLDGHCNVVVVGGACETGPCARVWRYLVEENRWQSLPDLPTPRMNPAVAVGGDGSLYVIGGSLDAGDSFTDVVEALSFESLEWTTRGAALTLRRRAAAVTTPDGDVVVLGGENSTGHLDIVERYITAENRWEAAPTLREPRRGPGAAIVSGHLVVAGGRSDTVVLDTSERAALHQ